MLKLIKKIKLINEKGQIQDYMQHVYNRIKFSQDSSHVSLVPVIKKEIGKYISAEEHKNFCKKIDEILEKKRPFSVRYNKRSIQGEATFQQSVNANSFQSPAVINKTNQTANTDSNPRSA